MSYERVAFNEMWDFTENHELEGYYVGKKEDVGENHSNIYQIEQDSGEVVEMWGSTALDSQFSSIKVGARVKIVFEGMKDSPKRKGKQFKSFVVYIDKDLVKEMIPF